MDVILSGSLRIMSCLVGTSWLVSSIFFQVLLPQWEDLFYFLNLERAILLSKQIQQLCMVWKILSITSLFPDEMHVDTRICKQTRIYYYQHSRSLACYLLILITKDYQNTNFLRRTIRIWCVGRHDKENEETLTAIIITICLRFGILSQ